MKRVRLSVYHVVSLNCWNDRTTKVCSCEFDLKFQKKLLKQRNLRTTVDDKAAMRLLSSHMQCCALELRSTKVLQGFLQFRLEKRTHAPLLPALNQLNQSMIKPCTSAHLLLHRRGDCVLQKRAKLFACKVRENLDQLLRIFGETIAKAVQVDPYSYCADDSKLCGLVGFFVEKKAEFAKQLGAVCEATIAKHQPTCK
jgi:hypothetical protein